MTVQKLPLSAIVTTAGTQIRVAIHEPTVDDYAEAMRRGTEFPPVTVFHDGSRHVLADGFHRVMAAVRLDQERIDAEVKRGTKADALKYALGANANHGLRRTNADKRRSAELALAEWPRLSDRGIADICAVSHHFIQEMRKQVESDSTRQSTRVGRDGKQYPVTPASSVAVCPKRAAEETRVSEVEAESPAEPPRVKTLDEVVKEAKTAEPTAESLPPLPELIHEVQYHLELVKADAEIILDRLNSNTVEPEDLEESVVELVFATKLVKTLARALAA